MAKDFENEEMFEDVFDDVEESEVSIVEKESLLTKVKTKVSAIGDLTLRDVGKGALKVGAAVGGIAVVAFGAVKLLGKNDDEDIDIVDIYDDNGNLVGFEVTDAEEVEATE